MWFWVCRPRIRGGRPATACVWFRCVWFRCVWFRCACRGLELTKEGGGGADSPGATRAAAVCVRAGARAGTFLSEHVHRRPASRPRFHGKAIRSRDGPAGHLLGRPDEVVQGASSRVRASGSMIGRLVPASRSSASLDFSAWRRWIFSSTVLLQMSLWTKTGRVCPMR